MYTRSQILLRSIRLRSIEDRQPKHTRVLTVAGGVDLSFLDSTRYIPVQPSYRKQACSHPEKFSFCDEIIKNRADQSATTLYFSPLLYERCLFSIGSRVNME